MDKNTKCPNCITGKLKPFYHQSSVPTNSCILLKTKQEALDYPRGDISLGFCSTCGFISNTVFEQNLTEYSGRYEETQGYSATFSAFHRGLAERLIDRFALKEKTIIEIGCGKGEFLHLLAELGNNKGLGFDPSFLNGRLHEPSSGELTFVKDFYSEKYSSHKADFICCKMTLEHIHLTREFVAMIRRSLGKNYDTLVFFQVPDVTRIIRECAFEDIYYEHCSYFSSKSLAHLFRECSFKIIELNCEYDDQYLMIIARPVQTMHKNRSTHEEIFPNLIDHVRDFNLNVTRKIVDLKEKIIRWSDAGQRIVIWGSGSKCVAFLSNLKLSEEVKYVVDVNPHRQGYFMPGVHPQIISPTFLKEYQPDIVIIMNRIYQAEISNQLALLGIYPKVISL